MRKQQLPPLPDLRFEQSYRRAIAPAKGSWLWIAILTIRDQVMFPLVQGFLWALVVAGYRTWQVSASQNGSMWGGKSGQFFYRNSNIDLS